MEPLDLENLKRELSVQYPNITDQDVMSVAMYPHVAKEFFKFRATYGPVDRLETRHFLVGPEMGEDIDVVLEKGKVLHIKTLTPGIEADVDGLREVNFELNGQKRAIMVQDTSAAESHTRRMRATDGLNSHVGAPMKGDVVVVKVVPGETVEAGQVVAVLSAMKMEMAVQAPIGGKVKATHVVVGDKVDAEDLLVELE